MANIATFDLDVTSQGVNGAVSYIERGPAFKIAPNAVVSASGDFSGQTLTISGLSPQDTIGFGAGVSVVGTKIRIGGNTIATYTASSGRSNVVITFKSNVSASQVQNVLRNLTFQSASDNPPLVQTITFDLAG